MKCINTILSVAGFLLLICINTINSQRPCLTPNRQIGTCILLRNCTVLFNTLLQSGGELSTETKTLIRKSWCGVDERNRHKVCCPPVRQPIPSPPPETFVRFQPADYTGHPNASFFNLTNCGNINSDKIHLGNKTQPFEFPWMALVQYNNSNNELEQNCGGSVITLRFVLTAAHCIALLRSDLTLHSVVVGEHNTTTERDCVAGAIDYNDDDCAPPIQTILIDRAIPHPKFSKRWITDDVGLLRLASLIEQNYAVVRICLPLTPEMQSQEIPTIVVTGWGRTEHSARSTELLKAELPTISVAECKRRYNARLLGSRVRITDFNICAGGVDSDSCNGDSGGPAVYQAASPYGPRSVQYGIVSAGAPSCDGKFGVPGLYARVAPYVQWIMDTCDE